MGLLLTWPRAWATSGRMCGASSEPVPAEAFVPNCPGPTQARGTGLQRACLRQLSGQGGWRGNRGDLLAGGWSPHCCHSALGAHRQPQQPCHTPTPPLQGREGPPWAPTPCRAGQVPPRSLRGPGRACAVHCRPSLPNLGLLGLKTDSGGAQPQQTVNIRSAGAGRTLEAPGVCAPQVAAAAGWRQGWDSCWGSPQLGFPS